MEKSENCQQGSSSPMPYSEIIELLEDSQPASDQRIGWSHQKWSETLGSRPKIRKVLDELEDAWVSDPRGLSRMAVSEVGGDDPVQLFVAVMVWGFGSLPYGPVRTQKMLETFNFEKSAKQIFKEARKSPEAGFRSLFENKSPVIPGLSIAMGTKFLYFCSPPNGHSTTPVVYDIVVYNALKRVAPDLAAPSPRGYVTSAKYAEVCKWMADVAQQVGGGRKADDVEYALFNYSIWKRKKDWRARRGL